MDGMPRFSGLALTLELCSNGNIGLVSQTVLIVDDHADFRPWTRSLLEREGFRVLGETADAASAVTVASDLRPDVVRLGVMLPDATGFMATQHLAALPTPLTVVLVSSCEASDDGDLIGAVGGSLQIEGTPGSGSSITAVTPCST